MSKITVLASGQITTTDAITIVLAEPTDMPPTVIIHWPGQSSIIQPNPLAIATVTRALVNALAMAQTRLREIQR